MHEKADPRPAPMVSHVVGDVSPNGEAIGLQIERSDQGPVDLCVRTQDLKYFVSLLLNLGCEARRRQAARDDAPPTEAIPLPLDAINVGQNDDDQTFLLLEVGSASGAGCGCSRNCTGERDSCEPMFSVAPARLRTDTSSGGIQSASNFAR
jgi:hypothetical protein